MARRIGSRYTVHQVIGRGSAGTVWLGEGPDGPVAVKLLREDLATDQVLIGRFVQERTALTSLDHPRVVGVHDLVVDGDDLALVMELVHGTDLRTLLDRDGPLSPEAAASIVADVAEGLAVAHAAGIVHRDVKPENILLDLASSPGPGRAPRAKLTDFGIARLVDAPRRTRATRIIGTPDYLAPEIIEGLEPRAAVDIYALATVLYELLAGFTPFGGGHTGAVLRRHVTETVPPLPGLPEEFARVFTGCLAKAPASRLRAGELADRLRELLPGLEGVPILSLPSPEEDGGADAGQRGGARPATEPPGGAEDPAPDGVAPAAGPRWRRGPAVPLVAGRRPDSSRDTHTSLRRPSHDELAAYAAESRAQRAEAEAVRTAGAGAADPAGAPAAGSEGPRAGAADGSGGSDGSDGSGGSGGNGGVGNPHSHRRPGRTPGAAAVFRRRRLVAAAVALLVAGGAVAVYEASGDGHSSGGQSSEDHTGSGAPSGSPGAARPTAPVARQADAGTAGPADALPASWSAWVAAPAPPAALTGGLRAARLGDGTELVFGTDADGGVRYLSRTASGFAGWTRLTGIHVVGEPAPVALSGNRLRLFALGTDGLLYQRTLTGGRTGGWTPWGQVDGRTHYDAPPAAASPDGSTVVLVGRIAGDLVTSTATDGDWTAPATVPTAGRITGTPALIADGRGRVDAFVQPAGGGEVRRLTAVDGVWNAAQTLRGLPGGARAEAVSAPSGALWVLSGGNVAVSSRHPGVSGTGGAWRIGRLPAQAAGPGAVAAVSDRSGVTVFAPTAQGSVAYATST